MIGRWRRSRAAVEPPVRVALIGAGPHARNIHLPNLQRLGATYELELIVDVDEGIAREMGARYETRATTDLRDCLENPQIEAVIIATPVWTHAEIAAEAARAGKAIFLEKPVVRTVDELRALDRVLEETRASFLVGFNRRFSPFSRAVRDRVARRRDPLVVAYRTNVVATGSFPPDHPIHGPRIGGLNLEDCCHAYDLLTFLIGAPVEEIHASAIVPRSGDHRANANFVCSLRFADGSVASHVFTTLGHPSLAKERIEIFHDGDAIVLDDFRRVEVSGQPYGPNPTARPSKGQIDELRLFAEHLRAGTIGDLMAKWEWVQATEISFEVERLLRADR